MEWSRRVRLARHAIKSDFMADSSIAESSRVGGRWASIFESTNLREPASVLRAAAFAAITTALLYTLAGIDSGLWYCALFAPFPILAIAPEIRLETGAELACAAFLVGNLAAWGGESFAVPIVTMLASHIAGAIVFATFVALAAEATRR